MLSRTEFELTEYVEKLVTVLSENELVELQPSDSWAVNLSTEPPILYYRVAEAGTMGDKLLGVISHEIAHMLFTEEYRDELTWDTRKRPKTAHMLINVVEDKRIETIFAEDFPGAETLFEVLHKENWDAQALKQFFKLPAKWKFIMNIDRKLNGLHALGTPEDVQAIRNAWASIEDAVYQSNTIDLANALEPAFLEMLRLVEIEEEQQKQDQQPQPNPNQQGGEAGDQIQSQSTEDEADQQRTGESSDSGSESMADQDDHQVGGEDGSPGRREKSDGDSGEGADDGKEPQGNNPGTSDDGAEGAGSGGAPGPEEEDDTDIDDSKPMSIYEEMVKDLGEDAEHKHNRLVQNTRREMKRREKEAKALEKQMREEERQAALSMGADLQGMDNRRSYTQALKKRVKQNTAFYELVKAHHRREILQLRQYAEYVLRENAVEAYGGSYRSGKKIKKRKLYRFTNQDYRLFEKRIELGGRSYAVAICIDQSTSMQGPRPRDIKRTMNPLASNSFGRDLSGYRASSRQFLAFVSSLVTAEAFEGLIDTSFVGFTDFESLAYGHYDRSKLMQGRTYKRHNEDLWERRAAFAEGAFSYGGTPTDKGILASIQSLKGSHAENKSILVITDGAPGSSIMEMEAAFATAHKLGMRVHQLKVGKEFDDGGYWSQNARMIDQLYDSTMYALTANDVPRAVNQIMRQIVKRNTASLA